MAFTFSWSLFWFVIGVSLLVTVHEFGHFWVARKLGFKVLRFSVGFGKPLFKKIGRGPDHTEYVIAMLPLGGYVRLLDERDGDVPPEEKHRAYSSKAPWRRILMLLAGPVANIIFAIAVLWGIFWFSGVTYNKPIVGNVVASSPAALAGLRSDDEIRSIDGRSVRHHEDVVFGLLDAMSADGKATLEVQGREGGVRTVQIDIDDAGERRRLTEPRVLFRGLGFDFWLPPTPAQLGKPLAGGPAEKAGLLEGDLVTAANGAPVHSASELVDFIKARPNESIVLTVKRDERAFNVRVQTISAEVEGKRIGRMQVNVGAAAREYPPELTTTRELGPVEALGFSISRAWELTVMQAKFFGRMLTGNVSVKNLSGAISIAEYAGESAKLGFSAFLHYLIVISLSLGFLNLLPIPILDGGQILFAAAEWVKGKPLSERIIAVSQGAGFALLVLLMGVALFNDISGIAARP